MDKRFELFRIYVWFYERDQSWVAEGKWWQEIGGSRNMQGTIGHTYFLHENLSDAINEVVSAAQHMNIQIRDDLRLEYSEKYSFWDYEDEPNPFPKPDNFEELIEVERTNRNWKS